MGSIGNNVHTMIDFVQGKISGADASMKVLGENWAISLGTGLLDSIMGWKSGTSMKGLSEGLQEAGNWIYDALLGGNGQNETLDKKEEAANALKAQGDAFTAMSAGVDALKASLGSSIPTYTQAMAVLQPYITSVGEASEKLFESGTTYEVYKGHIESARKKTSEMLQTMGFSKDEADRLASSLLKIPSKKDFELKTNLAAQIDVSKAFGIAIDEATRNRYMLITVNKAGSFWDAAQQLLAQLPKGTKLAFASGGRVPGVGDQDTVQASLTPGEFVLRKRIVEQIGEENLDKLNSGAYSYAQMLNDALGRPTKNKNKQLGNIPHFTLGGLVAPPSIGASGHGTGAPTMSSGYAGNSFTFGDINLYYPEPEVASEALPRVLRKIVYTHTGRA